MAVTNYMFKFVPHGLFKKEIMFDTFGQFVIYKQCTKCSGVLYRCKKTLNGIKLDREFQPKKYKFGFELENF